MREAAVTRTTKETDIAVRLNLDGGSVSASSGIGFFDHMLQAFGVHGGFGLEIRAHGDLEVDAHHTVEDTGIVLGKALGEALELASTAVRQLDRELRDNGEPDAGPSLRQVSLPSVQDWMDEVL